MYELFNVGSASSKQAFLLQAGVMFANGLAVLNNERFLEKSECTSQHTPLNVNDEVRLTRPGHAVGWGYSQLHGGNGIGPSPGAFKQQTIGLLHAMAYMRCALGAYAALQARWFAATSDTFALLRSAAHRGERAACLHQAAVWLIGQQKGGSSQLRPEDHLLRLLVPPTVMCIQSVYTNMQAWTPSTCTNMEMQTVVL